MSLRRIAAVTLTITLALVIVTAVVWTYLIATYESELGTSNVIQIDLSESSSNSDTDNRLVGLEFESGGEDLSWSSLEISLEVSGESYGCSFGSQSVSEVESGKIEVKLGADGKTFTTEVDATDSESFTYMDLGQQVETNSSSYWMKFSSTDIYLDDDVSWKYIADASLSDIDKIPENLSNDTDDRLEWYEYDLSVHRVNPNDGVYIFSKDNLTFKVKFLSYYNSDDESRYPTFQVAAVNNSFFPALANTDLVVPSPCMIIPGDTDNEYWNSNETVFLTENGVNICEGRCAITLYVGYETVVVDLESEKFEIGQ